MIIGHRGIGFCTLATDSRRRDHFTQELRNVKKLHKLSDGIILAQGGAGSGAADDVVSQLKMRAAQAPIDIATCIGIVKSEAPLIMEKATLRWSEKGHQIPPTQILLASVSSNTSVGTHVSIRLNDLEVTLFNEPGPYFTGSNTNLIQQEASTEWCRRKEIDDSSLAFDTFVVSVARRLEEIVPQDIGLPVDVGIIHSNENELECIIRKDLSVGTEPDSRFSIVL